MNYSHLSRFPSCFFIVGFRSKKIYSFKCGDSGIFKTLNNFNSTLRKWVKWRRSKVFVYTSPQSTRVPQNPFVKIKNYFKLKSKQNIFIFSKQPHLCAAESICQKSSCFPQNTFVKIKNNFKFKSKQKKFIFSKQPHLCDAESICQKAVVWRRIHLSK